MTADKVLSALESWIESKNGEYPVVDTWTIAQRDSDEVKSYPLVTINEEDAQEHPVLKGVMNPLSVSVSLTTVPHAGGETASATTIDTHRVYTAALYQILADSAAVAFMNDDAFGPRVWEIDGSEGVTREDDGRRVTEFTLRIICSNQ